MNIALVLVLGVWGVLGGVGCGGSYSTAHQTYERFDRRSTRPGFSESMQYLLYLPPGYESASRTGESWPMILFLHGIGDGMTMRSIPKLGPPREVADGRRLPFIIISPRSKNNQWDVELLAALVDHAIDKYRVDKDRIYVTGVSQGAYATWRLAINQPHRFAAIAPLAGWGYPEETQRITHVPVWAFHGKLDIVAAPLSDGKAMVRALESAGGQVRYTEYPLTGHEVWNNVYPHEFLYEWFLSHRRQPMPNP